MRWMRAALAAVVLVLGLPALAGAQRDDGRRSDPTLLGTERGAGTGILPNFRERGANLIRLQVGAFDPLQDPLPSQPGVARVRADSIAPSETEYWLVQVRDQRFGEARSAIQSTGAMILGNVPDDTYAVRATAAQRAVFETSAAIRWSGVFQPAWRIPAAAAGKPGLLDLAGTRTYRVYFFRDDPALAEAATEVDAISGVEVIGAGGAVIDVRATAAQVPAIAAVAGVEWIGAAPRLELHNYNARWVNDTGVRDLFAATAPNDVTPTRLNGAGQTAAVADTGLNYIYDDNGRAHIAFRDCDADGTDCKEAKYKQVTPGSTVAQLEAVQVANPAGHRKMVAYFDLGEAGPNMYDESSHGTHTAGSVDGDQPDYGEYNGHDGIAPAAKHVHQNIATPAGGLVLPGGLTAPSDLYYLFAQAYRPRDPGSVANTSGATGNPGDYTTDYVALEDARTHNNSWGATYPIVDEGHANAVDRFVWDHEDMAIVFSAGNDGPGAGTVQSPNVAKNDFTSGASANGRQPMVSIDSMAQFSSHGPTGDVRYGVDLATPGQIIISSKGGSVDEYHVAQGTSMSAPVLTGLATLVRQYFYDGYAAANGDGFAAGAPDSGRVHNPSAALVKATMVNGAERMRGYYTGDDGTQRSLDGQWPSSGQGFGLVNLDNSLYFAGDPSANWYVDVYRGDTTGTANCTAAGGATMADCTAFTAALPATKTFQLEVDEDQPLDVTLAWTDAPTALPAGTPALVNDLNLTVTGPSGTFNGNNMNTRLTPGANEETTVASPPAIDTKNNVERVRVADPQPGTYTVTVTTAGIQQPNQGFALAGSGDIQPATSDAFTPGPQRQVDVAGGPEIVDGSVAVEPHSRDTAMLTFETTEPTTATAQATIQDGATATFVDSYNEGTTGFEGDGTDADLGEGPVETSSDYADKPVVSTHHEILLTALPPGSNNVSVTIEDLVDNQDTQVLTVITPASTFGTISDDTQYCIDGEDDCEEDSDTFATQLYAGTFGGSDYLSAWMVRVPEEAIDPSEITGAVLETYSTHDWVPRYTDDPLMRIDLLDQSVEEDWNGQNYETLHEAPALARAYPETTHKEGAYQRYAWTFQCSDLEALRQTLEDSQDLDPADPRGPERLAAFRYEAQPGDAGIFGFDFGFNRRSGGPDLRPRLVLLTGGAPYDATGACDPATPAPTISNVGVHEGIADGTATVSWNTDVESTSVVLFREQGQTEWTQVATPALTTLHQVEVLGLSDTKEYEFAIRSAACNGATTTDANAGAGYDFFRDPPTEVDLGARSELATYDWESDDQGWTEVTSHPVDDPEPDSEWERRSPGASDTIETDGSRAPDSSKQGWHVSPYFNEDQVMLVSPPVAFTGQTAGVEFWLARDTEETFDFLHVEYSDDNGANWTRAASFDGRNEHYPNFDFENVQFTHPSPGGNLRIRFRFRSDQLVSFPEYQGVSLDKVAFASYPNASPSADLPISGPQPPESAGASSLTPPATNTTPTPRDLAAGTGVCGGAGIPDVTITDPDDGQTVSAGNLLVRGTASYGGGTPQVMVRATANGYDSGNVNASTTNSFQDWNALIDLSGQQGKTVTITSRLLLDGSEVDTDEVQVVVGQGGGGGSEGGPTCPGHGGDPSNQIVGTPGDDVLTGTTGRDIICGMGGDDSIRGLAGDDILIGGDGNDRVRGDQDGDSLIGQGGNDTLGGGGGPDDIRGGAGDDDLRGRKSNDNIRGNAGGDNLRGGGGRDFLRGNGGNDSLAGGGDRDSLRGGGGADSCDGGRGVNSFKTCEGRSRG